MNLPDAPRSVALDGDRHVWVRLRTCWKCVTDRDDADWAFPNDLPKYFGPLTVLYDAGAELL